MDNRLDEILRELGQEQQGEQTSEQISDLDLYTEHSNGAYERFTTDEIRRLETRLPRYTAATPTNRDTAAMINRLMPLLESQPAANTSAAIALRFAEQMNQTREHVKTAGYTRMIYPQLQLLSIWFWIGSIAAVAVSLLFTNPTIHLANFDYTNPVVLLAPLLSLIAVAYACRSYGTPLYELELSFPLTPGQWLTGKIVSVLVAYIALFTCASLITTWNDLSQIIPFTISWLVPLCLYSALTLAFMFRLGTLASTGLMLMLWLLQMLLGERLGRLYMLGDSGFQYWGSSKTVGAVLTLLAALYILKRLRHEVRPISRDIGARG